MTSMTVQEQKKHLRRSVLSQTEEASARTQWAENIARQVTSLAEWAAARMIFAYLATEREISVDGIIAHAWQEGKSVAVPVLQKEAGKMEFYLLTSMQDVTENAFGIREPNLPATKVEAKEADIVLVPGVAFSRQGNRVGMGGGYYDRYLPSTTDLTIGICSESRLQSEIPTTELDMKVHFVATERSMYQAIQREGRK